MLLCTYSFKITFTHYVFSKKVIKFHHFKIFFKLTLDGCMSGKFFNRKKLRKSTLLGKRKTIEIYSIKNRCSHLVIGCSVT